MWWPSSFSLSLSPSSVTPSISNPLFTHYIFESSSHSQIISPSFAPPVTLCLCLTLMVRWWEQLVLSLSFSTGEETMTKLPLNGSAKWTLWHFTPRDTLAYYIPNKRRLLPLWQLMTAWIQPLAPASIKLVHKHELSHSKFPACWAQRQRAFLSTHSFCLIFVL